MGQKHCIFSCNIHSIEYPFFQWFSDRNIWRMKQFYETYKDNKKLSPLVAEIPWTNNLLIMTACKQLPLKREVVLFRIYGILPSKNSSSPKNKSTFMRGPYNPRLIMKGFSFPLSFKSTDLCYRIP